MTLNSRAWLAVAILASVMCALLFGAAGTTHYWQAWVYVSIFLGASALTTLYLMKKDPALLARRMRGGPMFEKEGTQRIIMVFTSLGFIALLVVPALDHRFGWSAVPVWLVVLGDVLVAIGFYFIFVVYRENTFTVTILRNCRRAISAHGKLLIVERIIPARVDPSLAHRQVLMMDLNMLVMAGGQERTEAEYRALLASAGFNLTAIVTDRAPTNFSILEAAPTQLVQRP